jgi:tetratricopeptide (TPR) repeat protein
MRLNFFLSVLFSTLFASSQDTLLHRILQLKSDTERVNQLYTQGFSLRNSDPDLAFYYANIGEEQAHVSGSGRHLAKSYNLLGVLYYKKGDLTKALAYHRKALSIRSSIGDKSGMALSETNLGNIYTDLQLFERAEKAYANALAFHRESGDSKRAADCLVNIGVMKQILHQNQEAFDHYVQALQLTEGSDEHDETRSLCMNNMAQVFYNMGNYEKAIAYNTAALSLRHKAGNQLEVADSYLNLAASYLKLKNTEEARRYLDTAYQTAQHYSYYPALQTAFRIYAEYAAAEKNYEEAYAWLNKYEWSRDSIMAQQSAREAPFDFGIPETIAGYESPAEPRIKNLWLLISVGVLLFLVPLFFIRFKR